MTITGMDTLFAALALAAAVGRVLKSAACCARTAIGQQEWMGSNPSYIDLSFSGTMGGAPHYSITGIEFPTTVGLEIYGLLPTKRTL